MNERVPLSFLLAQNKDEHPPVEPAVPFPAMKGEELVVVYAILERTAAFHRAGDTRDTGVTKFENVLVDPDVVQWRTKTSEYDGSKLLTNAKPGEGRAHAHRQRRKTGWTASVHAPRGGEAEAAVVRERSDERARKNQEEVERLKQRELEVARQASVNTGISDGKSGMSGDGAIALYPLEPGPVSDISDTRPAGTCTKCGQRGRLDPVGVCHRHKSRPPRRGIKLRPRIVDDVPRPPAPSRVPPRGDGSEEWHGTIGGYKNHGCRCERCRRAHADYMVDFRADRKRQAEAAAQEKKETTVSDDEMEKTRVCARCGKEKPASEFPRGLLRAGRVCGECKAGEPAGAAEVVQLPVAAPTETAPLGVDQVVRTETGAGVTVTEEPKAEPPRQKRKYTKRAKVEKKAKRGRPRKSETPADKTDGEVTSNGTADSDDGYAAVVRLLRKRDALKAELAKVNEQLLAALA